jgi:hypothetical protein
MAICAFSGWPRRGDGIISSTIPGTIELGCPGIRKVSKSSSAILADLEMRGLAISFVTFVRIVLLFFLFIIHQSLHRDESNTVPFRTVGMCGYAPNLTERHSPLGLGMTMGECSNAEWNRIRDALEVGLFKMD